MTGCRDLRHAALKDGVVRGLGRFGVNATSAFTVKVPASAICANGKILGAQGRRYCQDEGKGGKETEHARLCGPAVQLVVGM